MLDQPMLAADGEEMRENRRRFLRAATLATLGATLGTGLAAGPGARAQAVTLTDVDILNFALNLEYLEAEYYLRAAFGRGLDDADVVGQGAVGAVSGGTKVPFKDPKLRRIAEEIARDEEAHVRFLRAALGSAAVSRPQIDLKTVWTNAARAAGLVGPTATFNPFQNDVNFLLGAYVFEDVGVTAYKGAAPFIQDKAYLEAAAGILAVEAYHAGTIRSILFLRGFEFVTRALSDLRDSADGPDDLDQGVFTEGVRANIVPTDANGIAYSRSPQQVLDIVYLGGESAGFGFFPQRVNGTIR